MSAKAEEAVCSLMELVMQQEKLIDLLKTDLSEARKDTERLDFILSSDAFTVWTMRDGSIKQVQLSTQDEDEEYHILSGAERYFNAEREAIDAAMSASKEGARDE